jgi:hypothetical protein
MSFYIPVFNLPVCLGFSVAALPRCAFCASSRQRGFSPPVPSDGTCPLHAGGVIDASLSGGCPPEFVVRRPGVSPPPPTNLPSKRWRDLILRVWRVDPLRCPSSLGGDLNSSFILHPSSFPPGLLRPGLPRDGAASRTLPGRSAAAARLRPWRWDKTARKPAKLACCRPPPALAGWGRNKCERKAILLHPRSVKYKRARQKPNSYQ